VTDVSSTATIEPVLISTPGIELSGLLCRPSQTPRGLIVALPGGGVCAGYWDSPLQPQLSLLRLGAQVGFSVLALDRPGYGASRDHDATRLDLASQVEYVFDALQAWRTQESFDAPTFLIGHSVGGILALMMAAHERATALTAVDVLGVPFRYPATAAAAAVGSLAAAGGRVPIVTRDTRRWLLFGPQGTYDEDAFEYDCSCARPIPAAEYRDGLAAPSIWREVLPAIHIPVQINAAEFEQMQATGLELLEEVRAQLRNSPHAATHLQRASGHNASQHHIGRAYHLRALAFFEECMSAR